MCCRAPWRAYLEPGEGGRIMTSLEARADTEVLVSQWRGAILRRGHMTVLAQAQGQCTMLNAEAPACRLQEQGGLALLPRACRDFPRSVVATPRGWEVAYTLSCPTAAKMALNAPRPFAWCEREAQGFPHPPQRSTEAPMRIGPRRYGSFEECDALRESWLQRLSMSDDPQVLVDALRALRHAPLAPEATHPAPSLPIPAPLTVPLIRTLTEALVSVKERGSIYRAAQRGLWAALTEPLHSATLEDEAARLYQGLSRISTVWVQWAAVHDDAPLATGLLRAYARVEMTLRLNIALEARCGVDSPELLADVVLAVGHLGAEQLILS